MPVMPLPFDLEDIVGVAIADLLRRVLMLATCVYFGAWMGLLAVSVGEEIAWCVDAGSLTLEIWEPSLMALFLAPLGPLATWWGIVYGPFLLALAFYFSKSDSAGPKAWAILTSLVALFRVLGTGHPAWFSPTWYGVPLGGGVSNPDRLYAIMIGAGLALWVGLSGTLFFFAIMRERKKRVQAELHLVAIAQENEQRREQLRKEKGIAVADREFATGEPRTPPVDER